MSIIQAVQRRMLKDAMRRAAGAPGLSAKKDARAKR
jgi:hypothetical protein